MKDTYDKPTLKPTQRPQSNSRYRTFTQTHFTAGDEEQFEFMCNNMAFASKPLSPYPQKIWDFSFSSLYETPLPTSALDTFRYIFHKFKKGIFIQIRDGRLATFLPFSNAHYVNEWSDRLIEPLPANLRVSKNVLPKHLWYANNYLIRYENPPAESDLGHDQIKNMFEELCSIYSVPDVECMINRRDFPLLKNDLTEPYDAIYGENTPLVSHQYTKYLPILSMVEKPGFADVAIPTPEDWTRVRALEKNPQYFASTKRTLTPFSDDFQLEWTKKQPVAVFRGSTTGRGIGTNNTRVKLATMTQGRPDFNVGITDQSVRYQINGNTLEKHPPIYREQLAKFMSLKEQSEYKYIIHVAGHVQAYRLSAELATGSVILLVEDENSYKMWFEKKLVPWEHYIPVHTDLTDLFERVDYCKANDEACKQIAINARAFYQKYLSKHGCLNYLYELLVSYRETCAPILPVYPAISKTDSQKAKLLELWTSVQPTIGEKYCQSSPILSTYRCFLTIQMIETPRINSSGSDIIFSSKNSTVKRVAPLRAQKKSHLPLLHEAIIGLTTVNLLLRSIPNFVYTLAYEPSSHVLDIEYIQGPTLQEYIQSPEFLFEDWLCILKQLALVFAMAQEQCNFIHHDACPWNILLFEEKTYRNFDYITGAKIVRVKSRRTPILIDYGRSYAETKYGQIGTWGGFEPFKDCLCLLVSSAYIVIRQHQLTTLQQKILLDLFNSVFVDCPNYYQPCLKFYDLITFLNFTHTFSHITFAKKDNLLQQSPLVLFDNIHISATHFCSFSPAERLEYTHFGKVASIYKLPECSGFFQRYMLQRLWHMIERNTPAEHRLISEAKSKIEDDFELPDGMCTKSLFYTTWDKLYLQSILSFMYHSGGPFALTDDERHKLELGRKNIQL